MLQGLGPIGLLANGEVAILGVVKQQIFHPQLFGQSPGFERRTVVLLVGLENWCFS